MNEDKQQQDWKEKNKEEQESVLKKSHKWESPEIDKIFNFWIHALISEYRISSNKPRVSNKDCPQTNAAPLDIYIEISASPLISATPLNVALIRLVATFY